MTNARIAKKVTFANYDLALVARSIAIAICLLFVVAMVSVSVGLG